MMFGTKVLTRLGFAAIAVAASLALVAGDADARGGKGGSSGSRGTHTQTAPPSTNTAPGAAKPIERSITQPGKSAAGAGAATAGSATAATASRFGGLKGILLGGLIGAGLASMFGAGAFASVMGFLLQALLIGGLVFLAVSFFRNRFAKPALATATASGSQPASQQANVYRSAAAVGGSAPGLVISPDDFNVFERLLGEVQTAYGRNDLKALETRLTPEMLSYFARELDDNTKQGVRNELSGVKLLQGDLSESWREASGDYATVAMRYAIVDATVEIATGKVVAGDTGKSEEVTEIWTFTRPVNGSTGQWELSAIQQV